VHTRIVKGAVAHSSTPLVPVVSRKADDSDQYDSQEGLPSSLLFIDQADFSQSTVVAVVESYAAGGVSTNRVFGAAAAVIAIAFVALGLVRVRVATCRAAERPCMRVAAARPWTAFESLEARSLHAFATLLAGREA
jgi:hypothetical protein